MTLKRLALSLISLIFAAVLIFGSSAGAAAIDFSSPSISDFGTSVDSLMLSTQFSYPEVNKAWIRKLVVKEDMSIAGMTQEVELVVKPDYPYSHTAKSFYDEVNYLVDYYYLDDDSRKAAYIFIFKQLDSLTVMSEPGVTNEDKVKYLRDKGIVVSDDVYSDATEMMYVGALYSLMRNDLVYVTKGDAGRDSIDIPEGSTVEEALMIYLAALSSQDLNVLKKFAPGGIATLDQYILATCRFTLFTNGYTKAMTASDEEVYRLMAIMAIEQQGISVDPNTTDINELRTKYIAAMLGKKYTLNIEPYRLQDEISADTEAFYLLQLMAKTDKGININKTKFTYDEAFNTVAKQTTRFILADEFYADVYNYEARLKNIRSSVWFSPSLLFSPDDKLGESVKVYVDGVQAREGYYAEVKMNTAQASQTVVLEVVAVHSTESGLKTTRQKYNVKVIQGSSVATEGDTPVLVPTLTNGETAPTNSSGDYVDENGNPIIMTTVSPSDFGYLTGSDASTIDGQANAWNKDGQFDINPIAGFSYTKAPGEEEGTKITFEDIKERMPLVIGGILLLALIIAAIVFSRKSNAPVSRKKLAKKRKKNY
ncbi:MAG: hypothetical protein GX051_08955 [Clostridiales bacterium]|nr:hypothetical protein [Clostridiales bacterium]